MMTKRDSSFGRVRYATSAWLIVTATMGIAIATPAADAGHTQPCADVTLVWARGSGSELGEYEYRQYVDGISENIDASFNIYELGTHSHNDKKYRALGVGEWLAGLFSGEPSLQVYTESMLEGADELDFYLDARAKKCPNEVLALGGFSQGANVIGKALNARIGRDIRDRIAHVALFGDPILSLPSADISVKVGEWPRIGWGRFGVGGGDRTKPAACLKPPKYIEPWRRGSPPCQSGVGILRAAKAADTGLVFLAIDDDYLPDDIEDRVGSWCDAKDRLCAPVGLLFTGPALTWKQHLGTHEGYATRKVAPGGQTWMEQAVDEAELKIRSALRKADGDTGGSSGVFEWFTNKIQDWLTTIESLVDGAEPGTTPDRSELADIVRKINQHLAEFPEAQSAVHVWRGALTEIGGSDIVFVIDSTGSMGDDIAQAVSIASDIGNDIIDAGGRVAIVEYRDDDSSSGFVSRVNLELTDDVPAFELALSTITVHGGGDGPEALLAALMTSFNQLDWRDGATKAAIVLTDAGYHNPDRAEGWTLADVTTRSLQIDPVNIYPVVPGGMQSVYNSLAEGTAGAVVVSGSDVAAALKDVVETVNARPVVFFRYSSYASDLEERVEFTVDAIDPDGEIERYEWDFDSDGVIDTTTSAPAASNVYSEHFDGLVEVRAISSDGDIGSAVASVLISPVSGSCPSGLVDLPFDDVPESSYAAGHITCIFELGVTYGTSATSYSPRDLVTREQMAAFMSRMYESATGEPAPVVDTPFTDVSPDSFARDDIARIYGLGINGGASGTEYSPQGFVTREQMAAFFADLFEALEGEPAPVVDTPFTDVSPDSFASDDIGRIYGLGGRFSTPSTMFSPQRLVTREQIATYLASFFYLSWQ